MFKQSMPRQLLLGVLLLFDSYLGLSHGEGIISLSGLFTSQLKWFVLSIEFMVGGFLVLRIIKNQSKLLLAPQNPPQRGPKLSRNRQKLHLGTFWVEDRAQDGSRRVRRRRCTHFWAPFFAKIGLQGSILGPWKIKSRSILSGSGLCS